MKVEMFINKKGQPDWIVLVCLNLPFISFGCFRGNGGDKGRG